MSRNESRYSMHSTISAMSVSPLSMDSRGSRRERKDGRTIGIGRGALGGSPFVLADGPPMFPLGNYPRVRRVSAGGLPPPVPVPATSSVASSTGGSERPPRSTWRSPSPPRYLDDNDRVRPSDDPVMRDRRPGNLTSGTMAGLLAGRPGAAGALDYSKGLKTGDTAFLPPRHGSSVPQDTGRASDRQLRPSGEGSAGVPRPSHALGMSYRGKPNQALPLADSMTSTAADTDVNLLTVNGRKSARPLSPEFPETSASVVTALTSLEAASADEHALKPQKENSKPEHPTSLGEKANAQLTTETCEDLSEPVGGATLPPSPPMTRIDQQPVVDPAGDMTEASSLAAPQSNASLAGGNVSQLSKPISAVETTELACTAGLSDATAPALQNGPTESDDVSRADGASTGSPQEMQNGQHEVISANFGSGNSVENRAVMAPTPAGFRPPQPSNNPFGSSAGGFGVTGRPSPLVNISSPLTRPRKSGEPSLFGTDGAGEPDEGGNGAQVDKARDLFAANAPAGSADSLFTACGTGAPETSAPSFGDDSQGGESEMDPFLQGPPPQVTTPQPQSSLPNPWGSSPLKQPLPAPKVWPTKGGTGFDRPLTPSKPAPGPLRGAAAGDGAIPAAFFGSANDEANAGAEPSYGGHARTEDGGSNYPGGGQKKSFPAVPAPTVDAQWANTNGAFSASAISRTNEMSPHGYRSRPGRSSSSSSNSAANPAGYVGNGNFMEQNGSSTGAFGGSSGSVPASSTAGTVVERGRSVKPPGVIAMFGFGGRLVCMHPRRKMRLASATGLEPSADEQGASRLRKGPVKVIQDEFIWRRCHGILCPF